MTTIKGYKSLIVYTKSFALAVAVFKLTQKFPKDELFGLTSQVRRSSRSVCANIVEGYRKRMYPKQFVNKLVTSDGECSETLFWLEMAAAFEYISEDECKKFEERLDEIGRILGSMIKTPEKFAPRTTTKSAT
jgi:four helix bundle protein